MLTVVLGVFVALAGVVFFVWYRPWEIKWGATRDEVRRSMTGDRVVTKPWFNATRAVTVNTNPEAIWPWLVQIGFGRAGWYSYDFLDNLGRHSAEHILPEFQHITVGDLIPMGPGENSGMRIKEFEVNRQMLWWNKDHTTTWAWALIPMPNGNTRLITRVRTRIAWRHPTTVFWLILIEVADFPLMRKCLLGIKRRAE